MSGTIIAPNFVKASLTGDDIIGLQDIVRRIPVGDHVVKYAAALARATRPNEPEAPAFVRECVSWGAGPRASQYLITGVRHPSGSSYLR